ncbi:MAG: metalloregulator ArsR/SmtB family transcription factor [Alphaproteobacteria bacterium]|nr:metalloregulator ArsR/SmtB family transcription factor [Alphaproteobacteria bacterium]
MAKRGANLDSVLSALADGNRRKVLEVLRKGSRRAGELADATGLAPPAMSRHLKALRDAGLVEETHPEFDARVRIYTLSAKPMADLKSWIEDSERAYASQQSAAPKAAAKRGRKKAA